MKKVNIQHPKRVEGPLETLHETLLDEGIDDTYNTIYELDIVEVSAFIKAVSVKGGYEICICKWDKTKFLIFVSYKANAEMEQAEILVKLAHDDHCQMFVRTEKGKYLAQVIDHLLEKDDN